MKRSTIVMLGIAIPLISLGGILLSIMVNPWFSLPNNALSDMGSIKNPIGYVFNISLILTGILGIIFGVETLNKRLTSPFFLLGMACLALVGVFPEEYRPHTPCAFLFYIALFLDMMIKGFKLFTMGHRSGLFWIAAPPAIFLLMFYMSGVFRGIAIPELMGAFLIYAWIVFITLRVYRGNGMRAVVLLSSGIDSPVAAYLMLKKGFEVYAVHFKQNERNYEKVLKIWEHLKRLYPENAGDLIVVDVFEYQKPVFDRLREIKKEKWTCVFCKYTMIKKACQIGKELEACAIITGDSLGQVASQTLGNLMIISSASELPILRPLIGMDKSEIERIAREIGTFDISIEEEEPCKFVPRYPVVRGSLGEFKKIARAVFRR